MCKEHARKLELICIQDKRRICSMCALFGQHKGHEYLQENDVMNEISLRTEMLIQMYELIEQSSQNRVD